MATTLEEIAPVPVRNTEVLVRSTRFGKPVCPDISALYDTFIFDCDGVIWNADDPIDGAAEVLVQLEKKGKTIVYVSNNSTKSRRQYAEKLERMGYPGKQEQIVPSSFVAASYLKSLKDSGSKMENVYVIGSSGLIEELDNFGINYTADIGALHVAGTMKDWAKTPLEANINAVVVGFDEHISYPKMLKAASYTANENCHFIATNSDEVFPMPSTEVIIPGTGAIVAAVSTACGRKPSLMGKPSSHCFDCLKQLLPNLVPARTLMVGDRLNTDIYFGNVHGMDTAAVLTGVTSLEEISEYTKKIDSGEQNEQGHEFKLLVPVYIFDSIKEIKEFL